jgi:hypothetical protein
MIHRKGSTFLPASVASAAVFEKEKLGSGLMNVQLQLQRGCMTRFSTDPAPCSMHKTYFRSTMICCKVPNFLSLSVACVGVLLSRGEVGLGWSVVEIVLGALRVSPTSVRQQWRPSRLDILSNKK